MKRKLGIIQVLAILVIGIMMGAFAERSHVFGYADNTPIIPNGTYQTTGGKIWEKIKISSDELKGNDGLNRTIVNNTFKNRNEGILVVASKRAGNHSWSYTVKEIKEGWQVNPIINGKPNHNSSFIIYAH